MDDKYEGLSDDELDRGLGAAFRRADAPEDDGHSEQLTVSAPLSVLESIRASRTVAATVDLEGETEGEVETNAAGGSGSIRTTRYDVRDEIARGGMGVIYQVRDRDLRRSLAMKVLLGGEPGRQVPGAPVSADHLNRFLEEAQVTAQLAHPGVVPVHELGVDAHGSIFFTMSLVRGKTLSEIIRLARREEDGWTRTRALQVILRVCETLAFAHDKGVIHRDIKPDNVMVGRFGETYVMDWGLAKVLGRTDLHDTRLRDEEASRLSVIETRRKDGAGHDSPIMTMDGVVVGTPAYMPPEQARGAIADVDERADVYAVGALLYELLTGQPPYVEPGTKISPHVVLGAVHMGPPKPIHEIDPDLPDEITAVCDKAMARERDDRYTSALELSEDIQAFIEGRVVKAYRTGPVVELRKWVGRNRSLAASLVAAVVIAIAGSLGFAIQAQDAARKIGLERDKVDAERRNVATQRDKEAAARRRAEGLRLSARAGNEGIKFPGTALGLAIEGAARADDVYGRTALYRALANLHEIATLEGHGSYPTALAFDASAERLVSASTSDGEVIVWDVATRAPLVRIEGDEDAFGSQINRHAAISRLGRRVATAADNGTLRISDPYGGRLLQVLDTGTVTESISWDAAGERLAIVTAAGRVRVWRPPAEEADLEFDLVTAGLSAIALRGDGSQVAVQAQDGKITVHDVATGERVATLAAHADSPESASVDSRLAWLDEDRLLLSWRGTGSRLEEARAEIWDVAAGRRIEKFGDGTMSCRAPVWSAEGATVALPLLDQDDASGHVVIWDAAERRERRRLAAPRHLYCFSPNGRYLLTNELQHNLGRAFQLWDTRTGELQADLRGHTYHLNGAAVTDDGFVATASGDRTVRLWRSSPALELRETAGWDVRIVALFADLGRAIVRNGESTECRSVPDGRVLCTLPGRPGHVSIDPASNRLAFVDGATNRLHVVDGWEGRSLLDWAGPDEKVSAGESVQFSPDGTRLAVLAADRIHLHDPNDGKRLGGFDPGLGKGVGFTWCPDGRTMVVYERATRQVVECDVSTGDVVRRYEDRHTGWITNAAVSRSGELLATGAADRSVIVWERATGEVVHRFTGLFMADIGLHFDPTDRFLVASQANDVTTLLDVERREVFGEVPGRSIQGPIVFDGGDAIIGTDEGERVLRVPLAPLEAARRVQPHPLTPMELAVYDVGDPVERAALEDAYAAATFAPDRILPIALNALADGDIDRAEKHLARIEEITPDAHERLVLRAALHLHDGNSAAALEALERAIDEGCGERPLRHSVFDELRETAGWEAVASALDR